MEFRPAQTEALRASNDERDAAVQRLQAAFAEGRFDAAELETRLEAAMRAKTRGDLDNSLRHIPSGNEAQVESERPSSGPWLGEMTTATGSERICGAAAHFLGWPTLMIGPALMVALAESPYIRRHAIEALNFQITFLGSIIALGMMAAVTLGIAAIGFPFLILIWFGLTGIGGLAALVGNQFRYPWALRLMKP